MQKIATRGVSVSLSRDQLLWVAKELKEYLRGVLNSSLLIISSFFILIYDKELKEIALSLFILGIVLLWYKS